MPDRDPAEVSFGEELKRNRLIREVSLESIASATKISARHLEALERGDFQRLPAPVFTRGFIRAYAGFLGLDPDEMVNAYLSETGGSGSRPTASSSPPATRGVSTRFIVLAAVAAAIAILVGAGIWRNAHRPRPAATKPASLPPVSISTHIRQVPPASGLTAVSPPLAAIGSEPSGPNIDARGGLTLGLHFDSDCWTEIFADERLIFSGVLHGGDDRRFEAQNNFRLTIGNAGAARLSVNGRDLPPLGKAGDVLRNVRLDAERVNEILSHRG
jgi:transcriptional regulator with XRE-family HTH domain